MSDQPIPPKPSIPIPSDDEHAFQSREDAVTEQHEEQFPASSVDALFPIVALGASAGGLEALERFFKSVPTDTGMAFVVVQHLDPTHTSMLSDLLTRYTNMPVQQITDGLRIQPNQVYVIPPNRDLSILRGELQLLPPNAPRGFRLPIDGFFRDLAIDQGKRAIAIILSGTGSDGSAGLRVIKEYEGMVMAQSPESAKYNGMPQNAIATHAVDFILPPEDMPGAMVDYYEKVIQASEAGRETLNEQSRELHSIFSLLRSYAGHDFSQYKPNTIIRRIERRMIVNRIDRPQEYVNYLQHTPTEIEQLFKELLIGVTSFFRDSEAFAVLRTQVIPRLFENRDSRPIRIWVPGCSTGEEAYSIAMLFRDYLSHNPYHGDVKIFATDIDQEAISKARLGIYSENIVSDVPPEFLQKYFTIENGRYSVTKEIRGMVVVANQSLIKDPPFSHLDLISCRNLLIYLNSELQKQVLRMFHYALNEAGYLFLGTSETLTGFNQLFEAVDNKERIFRCIKGPGSSNLDFRFGSISIPKRDGSIKDGEPQLNIRSLAERTLLDRYARPSVIMDVQGNIVYFYGETDPYLRFSTGEASFNILRMARQEIRPVIAAYMRRSVPRQQGTVEETIYINLDNKLQLLRIVFQPVEQGLVLQQLTLVIFELIAESPIEDIDASDLKQDTIDRQRITALEYDLRITRDYLQTTVEDLETSNEELMAANEELQSSNEELQSTNEELETTKEAFQAINEELTTVNAELSRKVEELDKANNDQINLLHNMRIGLIFLDDHLVIRLFNPMAAGLLNLREGDTGRPLQHFAQNFDHHNLVEESERVLDTLEPFSDEVLSDDQRWFLLQILPYRTRDNTVSGLVITFSEITQQKRLERDLAQREYLYRTLARHLPNTAALLFDKDQYFIIAEGQALKTIGYSDQALEGRTLSEVAPTAQSLPLLIRLFDDAFRGQSGHTELSGNDLTFELSTIPIYDEDGSIQYGMLVGRDITRRKRIANELIQREQTYRALIDNLPGIALLVFDHDLRYLIAGGDALEQAGYQPEKMLGKTLYEVLPEARVADVIDHYHGALQGRRSGYTVEYGGHRYRIVAMPVLDTEGQVRNGMIISYLLDPDDTVASAET